MSNLLCLQNAPGGGKETALVFNATHSVPLYKNGQNKRNIMLTDTGYSRINHWAPQFPHRDAIPALSDTKLQGIPTPRLERHWHFHVHSGSLRFRMHFLLWQRHTYFHWLNGVGVHFLFCTKHFSHAYFGKVHIVPCIFHPFKMHHKSQLCTPSGSIPFQGQSHIYASNYKANELSARP